MKAETYALALRKALNNTAKDQHGAVVEAFISAVKERGHNRLLPQILKKYLGFAGVDSAKAVVSLAQRDDLSSVEQDIEKHKDMFGLSGGYDVKEDPSLVGGFTLSDGSKRLDASWKKSLVSLYQKVIK